MGRISVLKSTRVVPSWAQPHDKGNNDNAKTSWTSRRDLDIRTGKGKRREGGWWITNPARFYCIRRSDSIGYAFQTRVRGESLESRNNSPIDFTPTGREKLLNGSVPVPGDGCLRIYSLCQLAARTQRDDMIDRTHKESPLRNRRGRQNLAPDSVDVQLLEHAPRLHDVHVP